MKKFLIALPLVLIMIMSMIPVMAADKDLSVPVTYYTHPDMKDEHLKYTETRTITVSEATLKDAEALKKAVKEKVIAFGFPKLDTDVQPAWEVVVEAKAQTTGDAKLTVATKKVTKVTFKQFEDMAREIGAKVNRDAISENDIKNKFISEAGIEKLNAQVEVVAEGKKAQEIVLAAEDFVAEPEKAEKPDEESKPEEPEDNGDGQPEEDGAETPDKEKNVKFIVKEAGDVSEASVKAYAYPKCIVDPEKPAEKVCPTLCERIKIVAKDVVTGEIINGRQYGVNNKQMPNYDAMMKHFVANYIPGAYTIASNWFGAPAIDYPSVVDSNCTITILLLPKFVHVNVIHELYNCCKEIDGNVNYQLYKTFVEKDQVVEFFDYHTKLMVDNSKAAEFALTRLQKINANDFVFIKAIFDDGIRLDQYMNGNVYDLDGNLIKRETVTNQLPTIKLIYHRAECVEKTEEKVDNATVENNNATTAPVTNSGTQLPATGAKDVTAFFLSAVALLGLGIFFAKKH